MNSNWCNKDHCNEDDHETKMISGRSLPLVKLKSDAQTCGRPFAPRICSLMGLVYLTSLCRFVPLRAPTTFPQVFDMCVRSSTMHLHILELLFMLMSRLAGSSHLSLLPWKNGLDSHSPRVAYHLWYIPISLSTDFISSTQKRIDPAGGHCHICWTPARYLAPIGTNNPPPWSRLLTLSLSYLPPLSRSDKNIY